MAAAEGPGRTPEVPIDAREPMISVNTVVELLLRAVVPRAQEYQNGKTTFMAGYRAGLEDLQLLMDLEGVWFQPLLPEALMTRQIAMRAAFQQHRHDHPPAVRPAARAGRGRPRRPPS